MASSSCQSSTMAWPPSLSLLFSLLSRYPELLLALSCFLLLRRHRRRPSSVSWPVTGALPNFFLNAGRLHEWVTDVLRSGGYSAILKGPWFSYGDILLTCDPSNVRHVFSTNFVNYPKGGGFADLFDILGSGIFAVDGEDWKFQRRKTHGFMADGRFRESAAAATRNKVVNGLLPELSRREATGEAFDLQDVFLRLTFDTACLFVFGIDPGCLSEGLPTVAFAAAMDDAEEALFYRHILPVSWWKMMRWLRIGTEKKMAEATKVVDHFITEYISERTQENEKTADEGSAAAAADEGSAAAAAAGGSYDHKVSSCLLGSFLASRQEVETISPDFHKFLRDTAFNLMIAGRDTTSSGLTWFFWLLTRHPAVESKILAELSSQEATGDHRRLVYLHAALCESLRLFPPVPFEHKGAVEPDVLPSGHQVHCRRRLLFSLYSMGRMEGVWGKDCKDFRPERWISAGTGKIRHEPSYKFCAFNSGPRTCLGKDMAFEQMKAVAAAVIGRFRVEAAEGDGVAVPKLSIILHMKGGLKVRVRRREEPVVGW
ncbi:Cytochrome P450 86B1 [Apostasia shenzhenica]|uniref:noroxomaritidine synthase n=1 Tax=Apostasia shenzhenica TaxID=1088818 RepID=A0A2H9ZU32_9ASPA|nr:Cytochrome P450 86B1 [Apostasia shenzhenica]